MATIAERRALGQWFTAAPVAELAIAALAPVDRARAGDRSDLRRRGVPRGGPRRRAARADRRRDRARRGGSGRAGGSPERRSPSGMRSPPISIARLGTFDLVIGNPPYVRAGRVDPAIKRARAAVLSADWPELDQRPRRGASPGTPTSRRPACCARSASCVPVAGSRSSCRPRCSTPMGPPRCGPRSSASPRCAR